MAVETFLGWAKRVTEQGAFNLTSMVTFVEETETYWREKGKTFHVPGWRKCAGREEGKGLVPRTMKHPVTGATFVFPVFTFTRTEGDLVQATLREPKCPHCGGSMERRARRDGSGDFFGCSSYPHCKGACNAWTSVDAPLAPKPEGEPAPKPQPKAVPAPSALVARICKLVEQARAIVEKHGMCLPIGYRTTRHLAHLAVICGDADEAWRLWVDGRVSEQERAKFDAEGMPAGRFTMPEKTEDGEPGWYETVARVLDAGLPVFLQGPAGTGKTRFAGWYATRTERTLETMVGSGDVAGRELWVARRDASKGETTTVPGPAARACENGDVLLLDEVDGFDANSLLPLNSVLNGDTEVSVPVLGKVKVDPAVRVIAAANTNGRSKDRTYTARNRLDGAFLNRFAVVIETRYETSVDQKVAEEVLKLLGA